MTRRRRKATWQKTSKGTWTLSLGERGCRVTLRENSQKGGMIYREVYLGSGKKSRCSLHTRDRDHAEELARKFLAALLAGQRKPISDTPRLGLLCDRFFAESAVLKDNTERSREESKSSLKIIRAILGDQREVRTLSKNVVDEYEARRKAGGVRYGEDGETGPVRQRSVQADIKLLKQVLYWACATINPDGSRLLDQNPLEYVKVKAEPDVRRPVASFERYEATVKSMRGLQQRYEREMTSLDSEPARHRARGRFETWVRAEMGIFLLERTGKRRGSVVALKWDDFDFSAGRVTWRAEADKKRKTWDIPYPADFFEAMRAFQRRLGAFGGPLFPRADQPDVTMPPAILSQRIRQAEDLAGLPKLRGGTCHPFRRKWRSERRHLPVKAVAQAGGWSDVATMEKCYDIPDDVDVLAVTSDRNKRREALPASISATN